MQDRIVQRLQFHNPLHGLEVPALPVHRPREDLITRMRDHEKLGSYSKLRTL